MSRSIASSLVRLKLSLHDATNSHDITRNASVNKVIPDFAIDGLRHLASVDTLHISLDLLKPDPLVETSLGCVLLRSEDLALAVLVLATIGRFPLAVYEVDKELLFALEADKLDAFNVDFDRADSEHRAS